MARGLWCSGVSGFRGFRIWVYGLRVSPVSGFRAVGLCAGVWRDPANEETQMPRTFSQAVQSTSAKCYVALGKNFFACGGHQPYRGGGRGKAGKAP